MQSEKSLLDDILSQGKRGKANPKKRLDSNKKINQKLDSYPQPNLADMYLTSQGYTQAILKISSYGKGRQKVSNHLSYISRNGELALEDENGNFICGLEEQEALLDEWETDFGDNQRSRDTVHIILSAPEGYSPEKVTEAAREFLAKTFGKHNPYVFTLHQDKNHPHVHAAVKMKGDDGYKLDPRKPDLERWRKSFAHICRSKAILVEASSRAERGLPGKSTRSTLYQMKRRGKKADVDLRLEQRVKEEVNKGDFSPKLWDEKMAKRNDVIRRRYIEAARRAGDNANKITDAAKQKQAQVIAKSLDNFARKMPVEKARYSDMKSQLAAQKNIHQSPPDSQNEYFKIKQSIATDNQQLDKGINVKQKSVDAEPDRE